MRYTKTRETTFQELQLNAGVFLLAFTPDTGEYEPANVLWATSGGASFSDTPTFSDKGEGIDNCPRNTKDLKTLDYHEVTMSGTALTVNHENVTKLMAAADVDKSDSTKFIPRNDLLDTDFTDLWWVGDYSDKNGETKGGYMAIHLMNALNIGGFQLQSTDRDKGQFAFNFMAHYSMSAQDTVPYEVYIKDGENEAEE